MGPNTGQTGLNISTVVSLVSEEPEGLAPGTGGETLRAVPRLQGWQAQCGRHGSMQL